MSSDSMPPVPGSLPAGELAELLKNVEICSNQSWKKVKLFY
jgi:hypothetical protein